MFLNRREQLVALGLAAAFLVGSAVSLYRKQTSGIEDFRVIRAVEPPPADTISRNGKAPWGRLDLNRATEEELKDLPRIGPELARRIVSYRRENGPFRSVDDLLKVKGIGPKTLKQIRPFVEVVGK